MLVIIALTAFLAAILTFFSGFGLGTILAPVMMIFFPIDVAIALTGVVHFANGLFKLILIGGRADRGVLLRFGLPALIAAPIGAWVLFYIPSDSNVFTYGLAGRMFDVSALNLVISTLLIVFALLDLIPQNRLLFKPKWLPLGGLLSGFFGGLSGHQGALRSAFLIKTGLSRDAFIGTSVLVAVAVDISRLGVYASRLSVDLLNENKGTLFVTALAAFAGAFIGNRLLKKITIDLIQKVVAVMLLAIAIAIGLGWI